MYQDSLETKNQSACLSIYDAGIWICRRLRKRPGKEHTLGSFVGIHSIHPTVVPLYQNPGPLQYQGIIESFVEGLSSNFRTMTW